MSTIHGLVATAIGVMMLIIAFVVIPVVGSSVEEAVSISDDTTASVVITVGAGSLENETLNLSTETYKIVELMSAKWDVGNGTAALTTVNLTAEINANSTLFTAVDGVGTVTVTSILKGTEQNALTCTTNITGGSCSAATFTGSEDGSEWNYNVNSDIPTGYDTWTDLAGLIKVSAIIVIIGGLFLTFKGIKT